MSQNMSEVIVYDVDSLKLILIICITLELLHIILVHLCLRTSNDVIDMKVELAQTERELKTIKSVQVQFTQHSKLSRKKLKNENKIKNITDAEAPFGSLAIKLLNYLKFSCYIGIYFTFPDSANTAANLANGITSMNGFNLDMNTASSIIKLSSNLFWPMSGNSYFYLSEWQVLLLCMMAVRSFLRAILPALLPFIVLG